MEGNKNLMFTYITLNYCVLLERKYINIMFSYFTDASFPQTP